MEIGVCEWLPNKDGFDIQFDISGSFQPGFVECKNLAGTVSREFAKVYNIRAINRRSPVTFMLVSRAGSSLRSALQFNKFSDQDKAKAVDIDVINTDTVSEIDGNDSVPEMLAKATCRR